MGTIITLGYSLHAIRPITYVCVTIVADVLSNPPPQPITVLKWAPDPKTLPNTDVSISNVALDWTDPIGLAPVLIRIDYYSSTGPGHVVAGTLTGTA